MAWDQGLEQGSPAFQIAATENACVRVVAGPGAGKSFAMKGRVARFARCGFSGMPKDCL